jgi:hypothetical protein
MMIVLILKTMTFQCNLKPMKTNLKPGDVNTCNHLYAFYWKRGKCKGSRCSLCYNIDKNYNPYTSLTKIGEL